MQNVTSTTSSDEDDEDVKNITIKQQEINIEELCANASVIPKIQKRADIENIQNNGIGISYDSATVTHPKFVIVNQSLDVGSVDRYVSQDVDSYGAKGSQRVQYSISAFNGNSGQLEGTQHPNSAFDEHFEQSNETQHLQSDHASEIYDYNSKKPKFAIQGNITQGASSITSVMNSESPRAHIDPLDDILEALLADSGLSKDYLEQVDESTPDMNGNKLAHLTKIVSAVAMKQMAMDKKMDTILNLLLTPRTDIDVDSIGALKIPVKSLHDLNELNDKLADENFRAKVVRFI